MKKGVWLFILVVSLVGFSFAQDRAQSRKGAQLPPELANGNAPKIMGYDVAPSSIDRGEQDLANGGYPTNTSLGYKGIVMAEFDYYDENDELMADFGSQGLWYYNGGTWTQESGVNPEGMIAVTVFDTADDELAVDFGSIGLWYWNEGYWSQLSGVNPTGMFATDDDNDGKDEIQVDFGTLGVWRYDWDTSSWMQYSNLNPYYGLRSDYWTAGYDEGAWLFPTYGVWLLYVNVSGNPVYEQITGTITSNDDHASAKFTNASGAEDLVMDFGSLGIWLFKENPGGGWVQVSTMNPNRVKEVKFVGSSDYELLVHDNAGGLYWGNWNGSGMNWTLILASGFDPTHWCETFDQDGTDSGDEEVIIPSSTGGCWIYDYSAGETLNGFIGIGANWHINFMVKGDYYNRGYDSTMVFVFSATSDSPGVYLYDKQPTWGASWVKISNNVPDGVY